MAHFKRRRPKTSRAGCLMCKSHKSQRANGGKARYRHRDRKRLLREKDT